MRARHILKAARTTKQRVDGLVWMKNKTAHLVLHLLFLVACLYQSDVVIDPCAQDRSTNLFVLLLVGCVYQTDVVIEFEACAQH